MDKSDPFAPPSYREGCPELEAQLAATTFPCKSRRKVLSLQQCLDDYLDANAMEKKRSCCWRCVQGRKNREGFSEEGTSGVFEEREWQAEKAKRKKAGGETTRTILASLGVEPKGEAPEEDEDDLAQERRVSNKGEMIEAWMKAQEGRQVMSKAKQAELFGAIMEVLDEGAEHGLGDLYKEILGKQEGVQQRRNLVVEVLKEMERHKWVVNKGSTKHPTYAVSSNILGLYSRLIKAGDEAVMVLCQLQNKQVQDSLTIEHKIYLLDPMAIKDFGVGSEANGGGLTDANVATAEPVAVNADSPAESLSAPLDVAVKFYAHYQGKDVPWGSLDWEGVGCFVNKGGAREALRLMENLGYGTLEPNKDHPDKFVWAGDPNDMVLDLDGLVVGKRADREEPVLAETNDAAPIVSAAPPVEELEPTSEVIEPVAIVVDEFDWTKVPALSGARMDRQERLAQLFELVNGRTGPYAEVMRISGLQCPKVNLNETCSASIYCRTVRDWGYVEFVGDGVADRQIKFIKHPRTDEPFTYVPSATPTPVSVVEAVVDLVDANAASIEVNDDAMAAAPAEANDVVPIVGVAPPIEDLDPTPEVIESVLEQESVLAEPIRATPAGRLQLERIEGSGATVIVYEWKSVTGETIPRERFSTIDGGQAALDVIRDSGFFGEGGYDEAFAQLQSAQFGYISSEESREPEGRVDEVVESAEPFPDGLVGQHDDADNTALDQPPETRDGMEDGVASPSMVFIPPPSFIPAGRTDGLVDIGKVVMLAMHHEVVEVLLEMLGNRYPMVADIVVRNPVLAVEFIAGVWDEVKTRLTNDEHQA